MFFSIADSYGIIKVIIPRIQLIHKKIFFDTLYHNDERNYNDERNQISQSHVCNLKDQSVFDMKEY